MDQECGPVVPLQTPGLHQLTREYSNWSWWLEAANSIWLWRMMSLSTSAAQGCGGGISVRQHYDVLSVDCVKYV